MEHDISQILIDARADIFKAGLDGTGWEVCAVRRVALGSRPEDRRFLRLLMQTQGTSSSAFVLDCAVVSDTPNLLLWQPQSGVEARALFIKFISAPARHEHVIEWFAEVSERKAGLAATHPLIRGNAASS